MSSDVTDRPHDQEPLTFAYWVPNVSGGLVVSTIEPAPTGTPVAGSA